MIAFHFGIPLRKCNSKSFEVLFLVKATELQQGDRAETFKNITVQILLAGIVCIDIKSTSFE